MDGDIRNEGYVSLMALGLWMLVRGMYDGEMGDGRCFCVKILHWGAGIVVRGLRRIGGV